MSCGDTLHETILLGILYVTLCFVDIALWVVLLVLHYGLLC